MRPLIMVFLSCISTLAADTGIRMSTTVSTNAETGAVYFEETFTRNGETNLVRKTKTEDDVVTARIQRFYVEGQFVAVHLVVSKPSCMARESFSTTESSCSVSVDFSPTKAIERLVVTRKMEVLDAYTATNGVFCPVSNLELEIRPEK